MNFKGQQKEGLLILHWAKFNARRKCYQFKILMMFILSSELKPVYQMNSFCQSKGCLTLKSYLWVLLEEYTLLHKERMWGIGDATEGMHKPREGHVTQLLWQGWHWSRSTWKGKYQGSTCWPACGPKSAQLRRGDLKPRRVHPGTLWAADSPDGWP